MVIVQPAWHRLRGWAAAAVIIAASAYVVRAWPAPRPVAPVPIPQVSVYGVSGTLAEGQVECLAFLDEWMRHPGWQITLLRAEIHCLPGRDDYLTIDATGAATWSGYQHPRRRLQLSPLDLDRLRRVATASCQRTADDERFLTTLGWGDLYSRGLIVQGAAGAALRGFIDDVLTDHVVAHPEHARSDRIEMPLQRVVWGLGGADVTLSVDGAGQVAVRRDGLTIAGTVLDPLNTVAAFDWYARVSAGSWDGLPPSALERAGQEAATDAGWLRY